MIGMKFGILKSVPGRLSSFYDTGPTMRRISAQKRQLKILDKFDADVAPHVVNTEMTVGRGGVLLKVFQSAQVILVGDIKQVVDHEVYVHNRFS